MQLILEGLKNNPIYLEMLINELPPERMNTVFENADWSILDHIRHLIETQDVFLERLKLFRYEESPSIKAFFPDAEKKEDSKETVKTQDIGQLLENFKKIRSRQLDFIRDLSDEVFNRTASHSEQSLPLSFTRLLLHFLSHDHYHIYRIEELGSFKEENISSW